MCHDPVRLKTAGNGCMCFSHIAVQVFDSDGEPRMNWMHIVGFGNVAESLNKHQEGEYVIVSGPCVAYRSARDDSRPVFDFAVLVDSIRSGDEIPEEVSIEALQPEFPPDVRCLNIDRSMDITPFDEDEPSV